jgi:hypothetical protein
MSTAQGNEAVVNEPAIHSAFEHDVLDAITPGMPISSVMATLADFLHAAKIIQSCRYSFRDNQVVCKFCITDTEQKCNAPCNQEHSIEEICDLVRATLQQGGYAVTDIEAIPTKSSTSMTVGFCPN